MCLQILQTFKTPYLAEKGGVINVLNFWCDVIKNLHYREVMLAVQPNGAGETAINLWK